MNILQELLSNPLESSSTTTPEWKTTYRKINSYIKKCLKGYATDIKLTRGHFAASGFFTANNGQIWYISISDLRWWDGQILIRTAESYRDFTGGRNRFLNINQEFDKSLQDMIK